MSASPLPSWTRPLLVMSDDSTLWEWSNVLDVDPSAITAFCHKHALSLRPMRRTRAIKRVEALESLLDALTEKS